MTIIAEKKVDPYHSEYDGFYLMKWHDAETNALKRWFDNYKLDKYAYFARDTECLVVSEVPSTSKRGGTRYHVDIIDEGRGEQREYEMDHTAPEPPLIFFAAKRKYEPPPPKTAEELRREAEYERMYRLGYEPRRIPRRRRMTEVNWREGVVVRDDYMDYDIEWVMRPRFEPNFQQSPMLYTPPPPAPKHRRNV
jgi:hypothetical protein